MFQVTGRDANGVQRTIVIQAASEEDARTRVLAAGDLATVERVSVPPVPPPPRLLKLGSTTVILAGSAVCLGLTTAGVALGALLGHELDVASREFFRTRWVAGGMIGGVLGLVAGVSFLVSFLKRFWAPR